MSLDIELGEGATEAFEACVTFPDDKPNIIYGVWEYYVPEFLQSQNEDKPWPGPGEWTTATAIWENGASQKVYFQGSICQWGSGLCDADPTALDRMGRPQLWNFLNGYVSEMFIDLPSFESMIEPFINIGFSVYETGENVTKLRSVIEPNCRIEQWINWRENGKIPASGPVWDV